MLYYRQLVLLLFVCWGGHSGSESTEKRLEKTEVKTVSKELQARAKAFLERPIPEGMPYAPDNITDGLIARYATEGIIESDPELLEIMQLCILEGERAAGAEAKKQEEMHFFHESTEILKAIYAAMESTR